MPSKCFLSKFSRRFTRARRDRSDLPQEPSPPEASRVVMSGPCRALVSVGDYGVACPCPKGEHAIPFDTPSTSRSVTCIRCTHLLSQHDNASSSSPRRHTSLNVGQGPLVPIIPETFTTRAETVSSLWHRIKKEQVVHVRGTPASGKSTLANFLKVHVANTEPDIKVRSVTWTENIRGCGTFTSYYRLLNTLSGRPIDLDDWLLEKCLLIIDEAQASYQFTSLWNDLIKLIEPGYGIFIVLFSSYGSPSRGSLEAKTQTPLYFRPTQRIGIKRNTSNPDLCLFFSRPELDEVVDRVCKSYGDHRRFRPSADLVDYIWDLTNGHPSGVQAVLTELAETSVLRKFRKESLEISLSHAIDYLLSDDFLRQMARTSKFGRGLPPSSFLQNRPDVVRFLKEAVVLTHLEGAADPGTPLEVCYKQGWIQAELSSDGDDDEPSDTVYVFPSNLHRRCVELMVPRPDVPFPSHIYPTVKSLAFATIRKFSATALKMEKPNLGPGGVPRPLEASFQDEFYRACYKTLDNSSFLTPEWSDPTIYGWIDFRVKTQGWVVECVRDGNELDEHVSRFQPGGRYYAGIQSGKITDCILLDFRRSVPRKARRNVKWLYHVVFAADFSEYTICNSKGEAEGGEKSIALLE